VAPRKVDGWPPRWLTFNATKRTATRGDEAIEFINTYCRITKSSVGGAAGERIVLRPWQEQLVRSLLALKPAGNSSQKVLRHRTGLAGLPRKNGKSALGSGLALWSLFLGDPGGEVYSCASTREQARIVFDTAKRMVELDPELSQLAKVYRDAIEYPDTGSVYRVLSREAGASEGLSPTFTVFDELHVQGDDDLWNVMQLGAGARHEPMLLGITTAGSRTDNLGRDSICYRLYQHGRAVCSGETEDPTFFFSWWEPSAGTDSDHTDPKVWREANPGFGDLNSIEDFQSTLVRTPEAEFRTKRTNLWVVGQTAALPHGAWSKLAEPDRTISPDTPVVLMADGSWSGDSTGIIGITVEDKPHMFVIDLWERPADSNEWRVPVSEVETRIKDTARAMPVREIGMDPFRWQRSMQLLEDEGLPMLEFPMGNVDRMVKAWKKFYDGVLDGLFTHSGDPRLDRHVENMVLKFDSRGARPTKDAKQSTRHIDLGVCAVAGMDRALWHCGQTFVDVSTQIF
jgi:phage terminase large subunit-like protein